MISALSAFKSSIEESAEWLDELAADLGVDQRRAIRALGAGLHTIRDRLPAVEAVALGAELPMLVRGLYYEGWQLASRLQRPQDRQAILKLMEHRTGRDASLDPEDALKAVIRVIERHLSGSDLADVYASIPDPMADLWTEASREAARSAG